MKSQTLTGKVFLVTGSTSGIGRELSRMMLMDGVRVIINGRGADANCKVATEFREFEVNYRFVPADVSDPESCAGLIDSTIAAFGRLDGIILNAGITCRGNVEDLQPAVPEKVIGTNLISSFYLLRYAVPHIRKTKGSVIFVSSLAGIHGIPGHAPYSAAKMGQFALYQSLKKELHGSGVFVGIAMAGFTKNDESKMRLDCNGKPEPIPSRSTFAPASQHFTARKIYNQLLRRRPPVGLHSAGAWLTMKLTAWLPALAHRVVLWQWKRKKF